jgi:decaprenyl-phosphate phosphoribosyltransferase
MSNAQAALDLVWFRAIIKLLRPKHWVKNSFVVAPLIFSGQFLEPNAIKLALEAYFLFCVAASSVYILNDYRDIEYDRLHPTKRLKRPLAAGAVSKLQAMMLLAVLYSILGFAAWQMPAVIALLGLYLALNLAYSFGLKHQPIWDLFIVASGFVIRVMVGAVAIDVPLSSWMFITTFCLALYLATIKRRQELRLSGSESRKVLAHYTVELIDRYAEMAAMGALLFYSLFVMTARPELILSIPVVLFGLFRYWYLVEQSDEGESPTEVLLTDMQLMGAVLIWVGACAWALWPEL